ncbi:hypothetical protein HYDPIDRAFT_118958 [Hydnomerulius pinastri MD-312]|uniref:Peptidase A1 domain-containing protein n=1 Tax=Hydnomerulius pinastri MD-312 TaxID=994086 RepID=A0A0C9V0Y2_9AGAM|nr:hypothetical protein HYDPIDRAFT_118958 [Hydnomerulius pinastri MD-312]
MAFKSSSDYNANPVFQTLVADGKTDNSVLTFKLASSGSELYIGRTNCDLYTGDFTYVDVAQEGYWEVNMDGVVVNGKTVLISIDSIIDTGTTIIVGQPFDVATLYKAIGGTDASSTAGDGFYTCTILSSCSSMSFS